MRAGLGAFVTNAQMVVYTREAANIDWGWNFTATQSSFDLSFAQPIIAS